MKREDEVDRGRWLGAETDSWLRKEKTKRGRLIADSIIRRLISGSNPIHKREASSEKGRGISC